MYSTHMYSTVESIFRNHEQQRLVAYLISNSREGSHGEVQPLAINCGVLKTFSHPDSCMCTIAALPIKAGMLRSRAASARVDVGGAAAQYLKGIVMLQILWLKTVARLAKQFSRMALIKPIWRVQGVQKGKIIGKIGKP